MITYTIFVVDDEESIRDGITLNLGNDYHVEAFSSAETAIDAVESNPPDLVLLDVGLPGMSGVDALQKIKNLNPDIRVIMITAYEDVDTVVSAMKHGAYDYIVKPIQMDRLEVTIENALEATKLRKEVQLLQEKYLSENLPCFIGESNAIQDVMDFIKSVAKSPDTPILILGETGTGKELIASAVHYRSPNFKGPLVSINCASIPKDLVESELFGYEKGAFSGAKTTGKKGMVEEAENGTLFLDEVGDLSPEAQAKLLRFLESGEFCQVGSTKKKRVQTRIVSATNKDLDEMMNEKLFRRDLYFRLGVIKVTIPSLNERQDDIIPLAKHYLLEFGKKFNIELTGIATEAQKALTLHKWTGNVRELKNIMERAVLTAKATKLTVQDLGIEETSETKIAESHDLKSKFRPIPEKGLDLPLLMESFERHYIDDALRIAGGNESKAAKLLNMNHHTFRYRHKKLMKE